MDSRTTAYLVWAGTRAQPDQIINLLGSCWMGILWQPDESWCWIQQGNRWLLELLNSVPLTVPHLQVTTNPKTEVVEDWEIINLTVDAHPIHIHEEYFQVRSVHLLDRA